MAVVTAWCGSRYGARPVGRRMADARAAAVLPLRRRGFPDIGVVRPSLADSRCEPRLLPAGSAVGDPHTSIVPAVDPAGSRPADDRGRTDRGSTGAGPGRPRSTADLVDKHVDFFVPAGWLPSSGDAPAQQGGLV